MYRHVIIQRRPFWIIGLRDMMRRLGYAYCGSRTPGTLNFQVVSSWRAGMR